MAVRGVHGQAAPTITSVSPSSAYNYAPVTITITGTGFQSGATVLLADEYSLPVTSVTAGTVTPFLSTARDRTSPTCLPRCHHLLALVGDFWC